MDAPRSYNITLERGKDYEIVITATNTWGEAKKEESKIVVIKVPKGRRTFLLFWCKVLTKEKEQEKKKEKNNKYT